MEKQFTAIIPIVRPDLIARCLETLYKYTEIGFYAIVIDQTLNGIDPGLRDKYKNLMIIRSPRTDRYYTGNIGFQKASNIGLKLTETPYALLLNDDVEMINKKWWKGAMDTFTKVEKATPESPALLVNIGSIRLPDWSIGLPKGTNHDILSYQKNYTDEDWDFLVNEEHYVNERLTISKGSVIDGINLYASVINMERLKKVGLLDELWYPGSAGDYDLSCVARMKGFRSISTTLAWVWHWWSVSFESVNTEEQLKELVIPELHHTDLREKWGWNHDIWGVPCPVCKSPLEYREDTSITAVCPKHQDQRYIAPTNTIVPL